MSRMVKKCHACGHANESGAFICTRCGADVSHLVAAPERPTVEDPTPARSPTITGNRPATAAAVRQCPECGAGNPLAAMVCLQCGNDLTEPASPAGQLVITVEGREYPLQDGDVIGRLGTVAVEVMERVPTISRRHLEIREIKGHWHLIALSGVANTTQLDGQEMPRGEAVKLTGRHRIQLSTKMSFECEVRLV